MTQTWTVSGMTCDHCVASVTEEIAELPGVRRVDVVLANGALSVDAVREAVAEAGYQLV